VHEQGAAEGRQGVVGEGGHQYAENDGDGLAVTRRQNQRQDLRLVADFGDGDEQSGVEEGVEGEGHLRASVLIGRKVQDIRRHAAAPDQDRKSVV